MKKITIIILCLATILGVYGQERQIKRSQLPNLAAKPLSFFENQPKNGEMVGYNDAKSNDIQPLGEMKDVEQWGYGTMIEDNTPVLFSQSHTWVPFNENFGYITDVTFKFYDGDMKVIQTVFVDMPDNTQRVTVLGQFSRRVFNNDTKFEFMVQSHYFTTPGEGPSSVRDVVYVVNENGEVIREINECSGVVLVENENSFDRAIVYKIFTNNYEHEEGAKIVVESRNPKSWDLLHTFEFDEILTAYTTGYCFDIVEIEGVQYMFTAHYEKPWAISNGEVDPETGEWSDPTPDLDNRYVITLYDMNYDVVKEMKFPLFGLKEQPLSTVSFGFFSSMKYDLSKNLYNNDDKFEVVYGMSRYIISCDCDQLDYFLLDEDGKELRRMDYAVMESFPVSAVKGFADQMVVVLPEGEGGGTFRFIDALSWDIVVDFAGVYNGELLTFSFDRVAFGDSYAYAFGLGQAEEVGNKIYGGIVYYNSEGREVKRMRFLLPDDVQLWEPIINSETLNPHVFDVDDEVEYISFMKQGTPGGKLINSFNIWKENGDVVCSWKGNSTDGDLSGAGFTYNDGKPSMLYILFTNPSTELLTSKFYELPFGIFSGGGSGTAEDPYVISTIAELELMRTYNTSHFILANDIDLKDYSAPDGKGWLPILNFSGNLNGNGKTIKNMKIEQRDNNTFSGFFGDVREGGSIKNLTLDNVNIMGDDLYCGAIAGETWGATITGCHVRGTLSNSSNLGGLVGEAVLFSSISDCSFEGTITSELGSNVGGIAGMIKTSSPIDRCFSKGSIKGFSDVGGITGSASSSTIMDCYSNMDVNGVKYLGGITGSTLSATDRNYATGTVTSTASESGFSGVVGGIIGYIQWSAEAFVKNNVAANSKVTGANQTHRISGAEDEGTVVDCYANSAMLVGAAGAETTITSTDKNSLDGADKALADMNKAFFESLTWKFGTNAENPWVGETGLPRLWFEFVVNGVSLSKTATTLGAIGATEQLTATVNPTEAINKAVTWTSSNESVATVSATGLVTAVSNGAAIITVTTAEGGFTATCNIEVNVRVTSVTLNKTKLNFEFIAIGKGNSSEQLIATITPENAANKAVTWSSSDSSIAEVDQNGMVSAQSKKGTAIITVTTVDGGFTATCNVTVDVIDGVNDINENNIKLYHANNEIIVDSEIELSNIMIYDVNGKYMYNGNNNRIQTGSWNRGVYVVKVVDINNNIVSRKIVI